MTVPAPLRALWDRTRRFHGAAFFAAGFGWDALTLTRIDRLLDNAILGTYLLALAALLVVRRRTALAPERWPRVAARQRHLGFAEQFFFGGLYSGTVIFYARSATAGRALVFVGLLVAVMLANEFLQERLQARRLRMALFTLCAFTFLLFFVPVMTGWLSRAVVGVAALGAIGLALGVVALGELGEPREQVVAVVRRQAPAVGAVLAGLAALEALHLIPPVPLAVVEGGIFHEVSWEDGAVVVTWEDRGWWSATRDDRHFRLAPGDSAWCFTAVFAPADAGVEMVHVWQRRTDDGWETTDRIPFSVVGGRGGGFRGYTRKRNLQGADRWRVLVRTADDRELARYPVTIEAAGPAERAWRSRVVE